MGDTKSFSVEGLKEACCVGVWGFGLGVRQLLNPELLNPASWILNPQARYTLDPIQTKP